MELNWKTIALEARYQCMRRIPVNGNVTLFWSYCVPEEGIIKCLKKSYTLKYITYVDCITVYTKGEIGNIILVILSVEN